jgi:hypothetical protein
MMDAAASAPHEQEQQLEQEDVLEMEEKRIIVVRLPISELRLAIEFKMFANSEK